MKVIIELEFDDDFEPCAHGCEMYCSFGYKDDDYDCVNLYRNNDGDWTCPVKEAMKKGDKDE